MCVKKNRNDNYCTWIYNTTPPFVVCVCVCVGWDRSSHSGWWRYKSAQGAGESTQGSQQVMFILSHWGKLGKFKTINGIDITSQLLEKSREFLHNPFQLGESLLFFLFFFLFFFSFFSFFFSLPFFLVIS